MIDQKIYSADVAAKLVGVTGDTWINDDVASTFTTFIEEELRKMDSVEVDVWHGIYPQSWILKERSRQLYARVQRKLRYKLFKEAMIDCVRKSIT